MRQMDDDIREIYEDEIKPRTRATTPRPANPDDMGLAHANSLNRDMRLLRADAVDALKDEGYSLLSLRPGEDGWESDRYNSRPSYLEAYGDGWIAFHENGSENENPYNAEDLHQAWRDGFQDAMELNSA